MFRGSTTIHAISRNLTQARARRRTDEDRASWARFTRTRTVFARESPRSWATASRCSSSWVEKRSDTKCSLEPRPCLDVDRRCPSVRSLNGPRARGHDVGLDHRDLVRPWTAPTRADQSGRRDGPRPRRDGGGDPHGPRSRRGRHGPRRRRLGGRDPRGDAASAAEVDAAAAVMPERREPLSAPRDRTTARTRGCASRAASCTAVAWDGTACAPGFRGTAPVRPRVSSLRSS